MKLNSTKIKTALEFYLKVKDEREVWIRFRKKDNTLRIMNCTLDFNKVPANKKPKDVNLNKILSLVQKHGMMHVFDLEKNDWRTVPFDRVEYIETPIEGSSERMRYNIAK